MSEMRAILEDSCAKLFARFEEPAVLRRVEAGEWPVEIWAGIVDQGLHQIYVSDDFWGDACAVLKACGRHAVPAPLPETIIADRLVLVGEETANAAVTFAPPDHARLEIAADGTLTGSLSNVAWGRSAHQVVVDFGDRTIALPVGKARIVVGQSIGREPRDTLHFEKVLPTFNIAGPRETLALGALMRAAQMAGAIEAVLTMTVQYARERQQFGKPIGSFQAIQHQLAILAGHSAAATRAVDAAFDRLGEERDTLPEDYEREAAIAKIRTGEAAGVAASIAHQTHGAIGFTDEHRLHYYTRRLWSWRSEFGSEAYWSGVLGRRVAKAGADEFWPSVTAAG